NTVSATTLGLESRIGAYYGGVADITGVNQLTITIPSNTAGHIEGVFTGNTNGAFYLSGGMYGSLSFNGDHGLSGGHDFPVYSPLGDFSGVFQSDTFSTGSAPSSYTIGSSWHINAGGTESFYFNYSYIYAATFVPVPEVGSHLRVALSLAAL